jgi:hypothetical protein
MAPIWDYFGQVILLYITVGKFDLYPEREFSLSFSLSLSRFLSPFACFALLWLNFHRRVWLGAILLLELAMLIATFPTKAGAIHVPLE